MNQSALKTFAQETRRKLRDLIGARLDFVLSADTAELRQQAAQVIELRTALKIEGRDLLTERVAYTWFNRLAALRFMDANGYHPFGARVITPATANETLPEVLQQARAGALNADLRASLANAKTFDDLLAGRIPVEHPEAAVYRLLLVAACNYYHQLMPFLFEKIGDATELLLPDDLLTEHSIVADFRESLTDEDCQNEEVLGWFYQYYISEKKAEVDTRKAEVPKEDIPAKTQLFTPHWIVCYLVENSLGRLWLLNRPQSKLREQMPYYIEGEAETDFLKITKPEDIRLLDPAGGSGHMLTYAFDLLYAIYEEEGYDSPEIPGLILRHNLYGVDICNRAVPLAAFALCMKARAKDKRFFRRVVQPHLVSLQEIRFEESELREYIRALNLGEFFNEPMLKLLRQFEEAKNFGSLIQPCLDQKDIAFAYGVIEAKDLGGQLFLRETHAKVLRVLEQSEFLCQRYHVVVTNPPYLGSKSFNPGLRELAKKKYPDGRSDMYAMFIERAFTLAQSQGLVAMVTMHGWMFLSSFEDLRSKLLSKWCIISMAHLGARAFDSIGGEVVQTTSFVTWNAANLNSPATFVRLTEASGESDKGSLFLSALKGAAKSLMFHVAASDFRKIPGKLLAYWMSHKAIAAFDAQQFSDMADIRSGIGTSDNSRFLRLWYEVAYSSINYSCSSIAESVASRKRWFPYNKGGTYRRWYGNRDFVVNWFNDGEDIKAAVVSNPSDPDTTHWSRRIFNTDLFFLPSLTWSDVGVSLFSVRSNDPGFIHDAVGVGAYGINPSCTRDAVLALVNSSVGKLYVDVLCPTMHFKAGQMAAFPIILPPEGSHVNCEECVRLARNDWDNFETSWDFRDLPLLRSGLKGAMLEASWKNWKAHCDVAICRMQELETENNRLFITAYGLQDELKPEVPEDQITLARADARKDMAAFISYAIGCMMGRYSLNQPGLVLADAGATVQDYLAKVPKPVFAPAADGIVPVLEGEWFTDDIEGRFREFLRVTFGEETLAQNIAFIESALGKDLRKYFVKDFYKDHLKTYKKRPIYWMFSSPEGGFQALVYLHRYTRDTVNLLLNDYVREFIGKLEEKHRQLTAVTLNESARPGDRTKAAKELGKIDKMLKEVRAWERDVLLPLAQQRLEIDLDDGVKVNYLKLKGAVVNIPGLDKGEEE